MRFDRRWQIATAAVVALLLAGVAFAATRDGDDAGPDTLAAASSTTSTSVAGTTSSVSETTTSSSVAATGTTRAPSSRPTVTSAGSPQPTTAPATCSRPQPGSDFAAFGATEIVINGGGGARRSCVLTADTPAQWQQGLMNQDDLDGYDGMIFRFPDEKERSFWMRNTRIPLSIAFFSGRGDFVSSVDMAPCGDSPDCPQYPSNGAAQFALEVVQGRLPSVGATAGSRLAI